MQLQDSSVSLGNSARSRRRILVNITSLIDVLFLLLIFFMVSSTFLEQPGMKLDLPSAQSSDISQVKSSVVYLYADGRINLNDKAVSLEELQAELEKAKPEMGDDLSLSLFADKEAAHGKVIQIMDIARQIGIKKLVVATLPGQGER